MIILHGTVRTGVGDFKRRMDRYPKVFERAAGETLISGTINVKVKRFVRIREDFRGWRIRPDVLGRDVCDDGPLVSGAIPEHASVETFRWNVSMCPSHNQTPHRGVSTGCVPGSATTATAGPACDRQAQPRQFSSEVRGWRIHRVVRDVCDCNL
jgi:hypothetical protein